MNSFITRQSAQKCRYAMSPGVMKAKFPSIVVSTKTNAGSRTMRTKKNPSFSRSSWRNGGGLETAVLLHLRFQHQAVNPDPVTAERRK